MTNLWTTTLDQLQIIDHEENFQSGSILSGKQLVLKKTRWNDYICLGLWIAKKHSQLSDFCGNNSHLKKITKFLFK